MQFKILMLSLLVAASVLVGAAIGYYVLPDETSTTSDHMTADETGTGSQDVSEQDNTKSQTAPDITKEGRVAYACEIARRVDVTHPSDIEVFSDNTYTVLEDLYVVAYLLGGGKPANYIQGDEVAELGADLSNLMNEYGGGGDESVSQALDNIVEYCDTVAD